MPRYEMFPYLLRPGPFDTANGALGWDLMFVSYMASNVLRSSIAFIAPIITTGPLLGAHFPVLGTLRSFYFWGPLKFVNPRRFDSLAQTVFKGRLWASDWHVFQLQ